MFATILEDNAEISKRVLSPDDIRAVCETYPAERDPHACTLDLPDDGCGCAAGGDPEAARWKALLELGVECIVFLDARRPRPLRMKRVLVASLLGAWPRWQRPSTSCASGRT